MFLFLIIRLLFLIIIRYATKLYHYSCQCDIYIQISKFVIYLLWEIVFMA